MGNPTWEHLECIWVNQSTNWSSDSTTSTLRRWKVSRLIFLRPRQQKLPFSSPTDQNIKYCYSVGVSLSDNRLSELLIILTCLLVIGCEDVERKIKHKKGLTKFDLTLSSRWRDEDLLFHDCSLTCQQPCLFGRLTQWHFVVLCISTCESSCYLALSPVRDTCNGKS